MSDPRRIVVAISGASGAVYGARLLQVLRETPGIETHLVVSEAGWRNVEHEHELGRPAIEALAHRVHDVHDVGASIASGSFRCSGMVIAPCSMRTLAAVAHGLGDNLITRSADVMLKERRRLVLMVRESPLEPGAPAQHGERDGNGRHRLPAATRVLHPPAHRRRHRGQQPGPGAGPAGCAAQPFAAVGRRDRQCLTSSSGFEQARVRWRRGTPRSRVPRSLIPPQTMSV